MSFRKLIVYTFLSALCMHSTQMRAQITWMADIERVRSNAKLEWRYTNYDVKQEYRKRMPAHGPGTGLSMYLPMRRNYSFGLQYRYQQLRIPFLASENIAAKNQHHSLLLSVLLDRPGNAAKRHHYFVQVSAGLSMLTSNQLDPYFLSYTTPYSYNLRWYSTVFRMNYGVMFRLYHESLYAGCQLGLSYESSFKTSLYRNLDQEKASTHAKLKQFTLVSPGINLIYRFSPSGKDLPSSE